MKLALGALVLMLVAGCGGGSSNHADAKAKAAAAASVAAKAAYDAKMSAYTECKTISTPLLNALTTLQSKVKVGISFEDFNHGLGGVQVVYDQLTRKVQADPDLQGRLRDSSCQKMVGSPMGKAVHAWNKAETTWNNCQFVDDYCDPNTGPTSTKIRLGLGNGVTLVNKAVAALNHLRPAPLATPTARR